MSYKFFYKPSISQFSISIKILKSYLLNTDFSEEGKILHTLVQVSGFMDDIEEKGEKIIRQSSSSYTFGIKSLIAICINWRSINLFFYFLFVLFYGPSSYQYCSLVYDKWKISYISYFENSLSILTNLRISFKIQVINKNMVIF